MEWISVKHKLPEDDEHVLVWCKIMDKLPYSSIGPINSEFRGSFNRTRGWDIVFAPKESAVFYWMPLPPPPKDL